MYHIHCLCNPTPEDQGTPLVIAGLTLGPSFLARSQGASFLDHAIAGFPRSCPLLWSKAPTEPLTVAEFWVQISSPPLPCLCSLYFNNHGRVCFAPFFPPHLIVSPLDYYHNPCPKALPKAGSQYMHHESGTLDFSPLMRALRSLEESMTYLKGFVALLSVWYGQWRQCSLGNIWVKMFRTSWLCSYRVMCWMLSHLY